MGRRGVRAVVGSASPLLALACSSAARAQTPTQPPPEKPPAAGTAPELGLGEAPPAQKQSIPPAAPGQPQVIVVYPPAAPEKPKPQYENVWYGWQTVVADGAAIGLFLVGSAARQPSIQWVGYGTFLLAPGIVHITHGGIGKGLGSIAMRLMLPPVATGVGALIGLIAAADSRGTNSSGDPLRPTEGHLTGAGLGAFLGMTAGVFICVLADAAALGFEKERVDGGRDDAHLRREATRPSVAAVPIVQPNGGGLGLVGRF